MNKFEKRFINLIINEADEERQAFEASLDDNVSPDEFDVNTEAPESSVNDAALAAARSHADLAAKMKSELKGWVEELDSFLRRLNGEENSIQSALSNAEPDTLFDRMKQSEQRKIARVATELASLAESFRGYISQADNPQFRHV